MTTPQPTQRDKKSAMDAVTDWRYAIPNDEAPSWEAIVMLADSVSLLLAQRDAEVRAEFAAFTDENGKPRNVLGTLPVTADGFFISPYHNESYCPRGGKASNFGRQVYCTDSCCWDDGCQNDSGGGIHHQLEQCYSTRDAALAARKGVV
jgi:hypothetical protein